MSTPATPTVAAAPGSGVADEITRSLGAIWARHSSARPADVSTVIDGDVVRCTLTGAVASFAAGPLADEEAEAKKARADDAEVPTYRYEATSAVARLTKRKVLAFIPRRDKKTDIAIETFILEQKRRRN